MMRVAHRSECYDNAWSYAQKAFNNMLAARSVEWLKQFAAKHDVDLKGCRNKHDILERVTSSYTHGHVQLKAEHDSGDVELTFKVWGWRS